jgi:hypothetical protein
VFLLGFVKFVDFDHFIPSFAADESVQFGTKMLFFSFLLFDLFPQNFVEAVPESDLSLGVCLIEFLKKAFLASSEIDGVLAFEGKDAIELEIVDGAIEEIMCSFFELFPVCEIIVIFGVEFFIFPLMFFFVEVFIDYNFGLVVLLHITNNNS